tara:strand:- start:280 stop:2676 length:2397 start_codon:yes stop_codon:yes gene_type:complete
MPIVENLPTTTLEVIFETTAIMPEYQREFAWKAEQLENLLNSLHAHLINKQQVGIPNIDPFFFGNMITVGVAAGARTPIVDGQQRLTAIQILVSLIRDYAIERGEFRRAYDLDSTFVWKPNGDLFNGGEMRIEPRDTGIGNMNPKEALLRISSLGFTTPYTLEVTAIVPSGTPGEYDLDLRITGAGRKRNWRAPWKLGVGFELIFSGGARFRLTQHVPCNANLPTLTGTFVGAPAAVNDTVNLTIGQKQGAPPPTDDRRTRVWAAWEKLRTFVPRILDQWYPVGAAAAPPAAHLNNLEQYLQQMKALLENTTVSISRFEAPGPAMKHFLTVNDFALRENLHTLDMIRATIEHIKGSGIQGAYVNNAAKQLANNTANTALNTQFNLLEETIWIASGKKPDYTDKFFERFLVAIDERKDDGQRYKSDLLFTAINKKYFLPNDENGLWNKQEVVDALKLMNEHAKYMKRAENDWNGGVPAHCQNEDLYLRIARDGPYDVWIPVYMAVAYRLNRHMPVPADAHGAITPGEYTDIMTRVMKALTYVDVAGRILPDSAEPPLPKVTMQSVWGRIRNWITPFLQIKDNNNYPWFENAVITMCRDINTWFAAEGIVYETAAGAPDPALLAAKFTMSNPKARTILQLLEWNWAGGGVPVATYFLPKTTQQRLRWEVEHVQPKSIPAGGYPWGGYGAANEDEWIELRNRLGNRMLLIKRQNMHLSNNEFGWKKSRAICRTRLPSTNVGGVITLGPVCGGNCHYDSLTGGTVTQWDARYNAIAVWDGTQIDDWESHMLTTLVAILPTPS